MTYLVSTVGDKEEAIFCKLIPKIKKIYKRSLRKHQKGGVINLELTDTVSVTIEW